MTDEEKVSLTRILINDNEISSEIISAYLSIAKDRLRERIYPFADFSKEDSIAGEMFPLPGKYERDQCELASRMIMRRGIEGQKSHNENGINRSFDSVDDRDILSRVTQILFK